MNLIGIGNRDRQIFMGLKSVYFSLEDKYYRLLDRIQEKIPIYSVVDPIDRIFPSFILFIIVIVLAISGAAFFLMSAEPIQYNAYIKVVDNEDNPLQNAAVTIKIEGEIIDAVTNDRGAVKVELLQESTTAMVSVDELGFKPVSEKSVLLTADSTVTIKLEINVADLKPKYVIEITDSADGHTIDDITVVVSFLCQHTTSAPGQRFVTSGEFVVETETNCGILYANFKPTAGYEERLNVEIIASPQTVSLDPVDSEPETGNIELTVVDSNSSPVSNAQVQYWGSLNSSNPTAAGTTDALGKVRIEDIDLGLYGISAFSQDGRTKEQTGIEVEKDKTTYLTLTLPDLLSGKKIFLKLVDSNSLIPLQGVTVRLYNNTSLVGLPATSNSNGTFERMVDDTFSSNFSAVFVDPSYLVKAEDLAAVDVNENQPAQIALEKALIDADGTPINFGIAVVETMNEEQEQVPNVDVEFFQSDYENPLRITQTGDDANVVISNLYPTASGRTYFAKAYSSEHDANGVSDSRPLTAGQTKEFPVILYTGTGTFEIIVVEQNSPTSKISGADITVFSWNPVTETKEILDQGQTDATGIWNSNEIKTDKSVRFEITAPGRKRFVSSVFTFSYRDQIIKETFMLSRANTFPGDKCSADEDCDFPQECNDESVCELSCSDSSDCSVIGNYYCSASGLCELAAPHYCDGTIPCSQSCQNCENNQCSEPEGDACTSSSDCCSLVCDLASDPSSPVCYNPDGDSCVSDSDCGDAGFACVSCGIDDLGGSIDCCRKQCSVHTDCPAGMACDIEGLCVDIPPVQAIKLVFEGIHGADSQDLVNPPIIQQGKTYTALFRLQLSMEENWDNIELHYRVGPDSDVEGLDQNIFILNIDSVPGETVANGFPQYSKKTDLSNVFSCPDSPNCGSGDNKRQVNMKYSEMEGQSDYIIIVKFKTKNVLPVGTQVPLHFQARGSNNGYLFSTEPHIKDLSIGDSICYPNCPPFIWNFHLGSATGPIIEPESSVSLFENSDYMIYYGLLNTTTNNYTDSSLTVTTDTPIVNIDNSLAFAGQTIPAQAWFDFGMNNPFSFSTTTSALQGVIGHLSFALDTESISDSSMEQSLVFAVSPKPGLQAELITISDELFYVTVKAGDSDGQIIPIENAIVRVKYDYDADDWENPSTALDWDAQCTTNNAGVCTVEGMTIDNAGKFVVIEASKNGFRAVRIHPRISGTSQTFGDPYTCLEFSFDNQALLGSPLFFVLTRPQTEPISIISDCDQAVEISVETLSFISEDVSISDLGTIDSPVILNQGETISGALEISSNSPLGYIPVIIKVKENNVWVSGFIAGRGFVAAPNNTFEIVPELIE